MSEIQAPSNLSEAAAQLNPDAGFVLVSAQGVLGASAEQWQPLGHSQWQQLGLTQGEAPHLLGQYRGRNFFSQFVEAEQAEQLPGHWFGLRQLLVENPSWQFELAGLANQISHWDRNHRFCGHCGGPTEYHWRDRARTCKPCGTNNYPRISPCVIVLVRDGERCLLARHNRAGRPFFTCLAGFIEVGENVEQCAAREVREEVGVEIGRVQYWGSQAWPFPSQLMLGYMADYQSGDICPEPEEIAEAHWYHYSELPLIPPVETISGQLIRAFVESCERAKRQPSCD